MTAIPRPEPELETDTEDKVKHQAAALAAKPDAELVAAIAMLPGHSAASESEVVHERACKDGSVLYVTSREGGPVQFDARPPTPKPPAPPVPAV